MSDSEELWRQNPMAVDQPQGLVIENDPVYVMQTRQPDGRWTQWGAPSDDRDKITSIQAYHLNDDPEDTGLRVWKRAVTWTLDEVPGDSDGQTPTAEILARNEENTKRLLEENKQPTK